MIDRASRSQFVVESRSRVVRPPSERLASRHHQLRSYPIKLNSRICFVLVRVQTHAASMQREDVSRFHLVYLYDRPLRGLKA